MVTRPPPCSIEIELRLVDQRMPLRRVERLRPDDRQPEAERAHHEKHVRPAERGRDPGHERCEQHRREVLGRVEHRRRRAALGGRKPRGHDAAVGGKRRRLRQPQQEPQDEQRRDGGAARQKTDEALEKGEERPEHEAPQVDRLRAKAIEQPASRQLPHHIRPAERRKHIAQGDGVEPEIARRGGAGNRQRRPVGVVDRRQDEEHERDEVADARRGGGGRNGGRGGFNRHRVAIILDRIDRRAAQLTGYRGPRHLWYPRPS